jgi:hypothetical protein
MRDHYLEKLIKYARINLEIDKKTEIVKYIRVSRPKLDEVLQKIYNDIEEGKK